MAFPTAVNDEITDSVTQSNVSVVGESPAVALSTLYQVSAQALGIMLQNAVAAQQQATITAQAAATRSVMALYSVGAAPEPVPQSTAADKPIAP